MLKGKERSRIMAVQMDNIRGLSCINKVIKKKNERVRAVWRQNGGHERMVWTHWMSGER